MVEHASMYYSSTVLREMLDCFLLYHEIMADPILKQDLEVLFLKCPPHEYELLPGKKFIA